jgi:Uma2 family endonuclease
MTAHAKTIPTMTLEEFFAWDDGGHQGKLELVDGIVRAMEPASATHALIQGNIVAALHAHLRSRKSPCRVAPEAPVVPALRKRVNARAPDIAVTCAPVSNSKTFDDPVLIIEVLSPGNTEETWESIRACAPLPTLQEIVAVESEKVEVQIFRRDKAGVWSGEPEIIAAGGTIRLTSIDLALPVSDICAGTHLAE